MIVFESVRVAIEPVRHRDPFVYDVDAVDIADEEADMPQHLPDGVNDIGQVEIARRDLVQHRGEEKEIFATHESHFEIRQFEFLKLERGVEPAEAAAEN